MTKSLSIILAFTLLFSFIIVHKQSSYEVNISFIELPSPVTTNYAINDIELKVYEEFYDPHSDSTFYRNMRVYRDIDKTTLINFLERVDWDTIPTELITPTIDGYQFDVDIKIRSKQYYFNVDNTYHPTFDSLLIICNQLLPHNRIRDEYKIYYSK